MYYLDILTLEIRQFRHLKFSPKWQKKLFFINIDMHASKLFYASYIYAFSNNVIISCSALEAIGREFNTDIDHIDIHNKY